MFQPFIEIWKLVTSKLSETSKNNAKPGYQGDTTTSALQTLCTSQTWMWFPFSDAIVFVDPENLHVCIHTQKISRRRSPTAVGFKQWSNFATQDGLMMAGTGFHSLSLFGDFLPALPRPLLDQRQDETCSLRKRA